MAKSNFVELSITDSSVLNFGKSVYELADLKDKAIVLEKQIGDFSKLSPTNFFQFHSDYALKLKLSTRSARNDLYSKQVFGFYTIFKKSKNSKFNYTNTRELYKLFEHNKESKFVKSIHQLVLNLSRYYQIITDIPNCSVGFNVYDTCEYYPSLYTDSYSSFGGIYYVGLNKRKIKQIASKISGEKPLLIISLANEIVACDLRLSHFKFNSQSLVIFN